MRDEERYEEAGGARQSESLLGQEGRVSEGQTLWTARHMAAENGAEKRRGQNGEA